MKPEILLEARKTAEASVADMPEGTLKIAAFQTILSHLLQRSLLISSSDSVSPEQAAKRRKDSTASGTTGRLLNLIRDGFFDQPRSLSDVRQILVEKGWHYRLEDLGTPITRLVQRRQLRRMQGPQGGRKNVWRYSNY